MKKVICFGEILWDIFPGGKKPGGAPMNASLHLHKHGIESKLISAVGADADGRELVSYLEDMGADTSFIQKHAELPTGMVDVLLDAEGKASYIIVKPVAWDAIQFDKKLIQLAQQADAVIFGSLACREEESRNTLYQLLGYAKSKVFDMNLRPPHIFTENLEELLHLSNILKVNDEELLFLKELFRLSGTDEAAFKELSDRFDLECLCITLGDKGALVWQKDKLYSHAGFKADVSDTVGSGDAFLASFIKGYLYNYPMQDILNRACAVGAYVASKAGANPEYTEQEIYQIYAL